MKLAKEMWGDRFEIIVTTHLDKGHLHCHFCFNSVSFRDGGKYCFACGAYGDVIDFVGRLFQLSPYDAARKLAADFHLTPDKPPSAAALHAKHIRIKTSG